ncbi:hypothetical protein FB379_1541 [Aeribacillus composti]|nr:hypothetical protein FB379_1541 [Aeribacillus composti]
MAPMRGIANLRSQPPHRGILRISPTNILLTLGDFAVRNGYYRYQPDIMLATVVIMIILVSIIQISGSRLASFLDKR